MRGQLEMANLSELSELTPVKALLCGHSGTGKTGALASLAMAGFKLRVMDVDNGISVLASVLKEKKPSALSLVEAITVNPVFSARLKNGATQLVNTNAGEIYSKYLSIFENGWKDKNGKGEETNLGKPSEWGPDTILVFDSLDVFCAKIGRALQQLNSYGKMTPALYGDAQTLAIAFFDLLMGASLKCHVLCMTHIDVFDPNKKNIMGGEEENVASMSANELLAKKESVALPVEFIPAVIGQAAGKKILSYANNNWIFSAKNVNGKWERNIYPNGDEKMLGKCTATSLPQALPISTGLLTIFNALGWKGPEQK